MTKVSKVKYMGRDTTTNSFIHIMLQNPPSFKFVPSYHTYVKWSENYHFFREIILQMARYWLEWCRIIQKEDMYRKFSELSPIFPSNNEKKLWILKKTVTNNWAVVSEDQHSAVTRLKWVRFIDKENKNVTKSTEKCHNTENFGENPPFSPLQPKGYCFSCL